jgi:hypothetical protein
MLRAAAFWELYICAKKGIEQAYGQFLYLCNTALQVIILRTYVGKIFVGKIFYATCESESGKLDQGSVKTTAVEDIRHIRDDVNQPSDPLSQFGSG